MNATNVLERVPIHTDDHGVVRVARTRVTLETVVDAFETGATAEEIAQQYPTVPLVDVYSVITYYLRHKPEVDAYLKEREALAERSRRGRPPGESAVAMSPAPRGPAPGREPAAGEPPLRNGMVIKGLARLVDGGGTVGTDAGELRKGIVGSYTENGNELTFHADDSGDKPINILPYVAGAISYTPMQGRPTISGEFTGCSMAIYNSQGETRVSHVDTATDDTGVAPSKLRWAAMKAEGLEVADELPTTGMLGDFLDSRPLDPSFASLSILAVASPVAGISTHFVVRKDGEYTVVG